jgi:regulator of replication initiation timing
MVNDGRTRYADDLTLQELVRLRVENERLREALKKIADLEEVSVDEFQLNQWLHQRIARAALKGVSDGCC